MSHRRIAPALVAGLVFAIASACGGEQSAPAAGAAPETKPQEGTTVVLIHTDKGVITAELDAAKAPKSVENFLAYVDSGHYDGTVFHRVIPGFMIQGGGFDQGGSQKSTRAPIENEAKNGLENARGTLAMARTSEVNSATAQFFINLVDNDFLNHGDRDFGYAVFGKVVDGMDVVDEIAKSGDSSGRVQKPVVIQKVERKR